MSTALASTHLPYFTKQDLTPIWPKSAAPTENVAELEHFELQDQDHKKQSLEDFKGHPLLINFFFTSCGKICPRMMNQLEDMQSQWRRSSPKMDLRVLSFSVMPEKDTPQILQEYAKSHHLNLQKWTLLTGDKSVIFHIGKDIFMADQRPGGARDSQTFIHTTNLYLLDRDFRLRGIYDSNKPEARALLQKDLNLL